MSKRKRDGKAAAAPAPVLSEHEKAICDYIKSKGDMGVWSRDIKWEMRAKLPAAAVEKILKSLVAKNLIKSVKNVEHKGRKHYVSSEFEPSAEVTGGVWYEEGSLDTDFVEAVRDCCLKCIEALKVATVDRICDAVKGSRAVKAKVSDQDIAKIVGTLVLDKKVVQVKSTGLGEFLGVPTGKVCFKLPNMPGPDKEPKVAAIAEVPCGVCPRLRYCTPDGIINPISCAYYNKLLDF